MLRSGSIMVMAVSRMFCATLLERSSLMPRLENWVPKFTIDVRVVWVIVCGLYMLVRLLRS